jgi:hypothetical protein
VFAAEEPASPITIVGLGTGCVASIGSIVDTYADELPEEAGHDAALGTAVHPPQALHVEECALDNAVDAGTNPPAQVVRTWARTR